MTTQVAAFQNWQIHKLSATWPADASHDSFLPRQKTCYTTLYNMLGQWKKQKNI